MTADGKNLVLGLVGQRQPRTITPKSSSVEEPAKTGEAGAAPITTAQMRKLMIRGESMDPIAGKRLRDVDFVNTTIKLKKQDYQRLKLLAVLENCRLNAYLTEAVEMYLAKIADRLPDIS